MGVRIQHRRDTAANWTSLDPVLSAGEIGYESDTNRIKIGNGVSLWSVLPYFADISATVGIPPSRVVLVDYSAPAVAGKIFNSWFDADAYVTAQSPSSMDRWAIYIAGRYWTEDVVVRDWVAIIGDRDSSWVATATRSAVSIGAVEGQALVHGCRISMIDVGLGTTLTLVNCEIQGTVATPTGEAKIFNSTLSGGNFKSCVNVELYGCRVLGSGTPEFGPNFRMYDTVIESTSTPDLYGGEYYNCDIENGTCQAAAVWTLNTGWVGK